MRSVQLPEFEARTYPASDENVAKAREFAQIAARERGWVDTLPVELVTSELVTNAGKVSTVITLSVGGFREDPAGNRFLEVRVSDDCREVLPGSTVMPEPPTLAEGGRGLAIVELMAHELRWELEPGGKVAIVTLKEDASAGLERRIRAVGRAPAAAG